MARFLAYLPAGALQIPELLYAELETSRHTHRVKMLVDALAKSMDIWSRQPINRIQAVAMLRRTKFRANLPEDARVVGSIFEAHELGLEIGMQRLRVLRERDIDEEERRIWEGTRRAWEQVDLRSEQQIVQARGGGKKPRVEEPW